MDANFRLKNHLVSNFSVDPGLWSGMAYMMPREPYEAYVLSQADAEDVSCAARCLNGWMADDLRTTDKHLRGLPGTGQGHHAEYARAKVYGRLWGDVRAKRDGAAELRR